MNLKDVKNYIVSPTLSLTSLGGEDAEMLLLCTGEQETGYQYFKQRPGPAVGVFQIEPAVHRDVKIWLTNRMNTAILDQVTSACYMTCLPPGDDVLIWNWRYSLLVARLVYHRAKPPIPSYKDVPALAKYYCDYYNTSLGKAKLENVITVFEKVVNQFI